MNTWCKIIEFSALHKLAPVDQACSSKASTSTGLVNDPAPVKEANIPQETSQEDTQSEEESIAFKLRKTKKD